MATVLRKPTSKFWFAAYRDASGRQYRRSTFEIDKKRAQKVADQYQLIAMRKGNPQKVRETIAHFLKEHYQEDLPNVTVRQFVNRWLQDRNQETSPATMAIYEKTSERFLSFLGSGAERGIASVTRTKITDYRNDLAGKLAAATVNRDLKIVKMIFRKARLDRYLFEDPAEGVNIVKRRSHEKSRRPLTVPEIQSILAVADPEWQSLIKFGLYTGQRLGDLASLTWANIDRPRGEIRMVSRKTGKRLLLPITGALRQHVESLSRSDRYDVPLHPRAYEIVNSQKGRSGTLSNAFIELMIQAGLRPARTHQSTGKGRAARRVGMDISFHSLRHSAVSILKDAGIPDSVVMALVGHDSAAMSARYTSVGKESLEKAQAAMPQL
jgi:integrase